ncbi:MAG: GTPase Era, partial [Eggerthellaceae bacterium]|nr:GTPase Era [Eggerthellaceae bacterium]
MDLDEYFANNSQYPAFKEGYKSGFVTLIGRPNAGKSTLLNALVGKKIAITSDTAQTTRHRFRGIITTDDYQVILVDTPGLHKPHDALGEQLNVSAIKALEDVDVVAMLIDSSAPIGRGDEWVASQLKDVRAKRICVLTKTDLSTSDQIAAQAQAAEELCAWDALVACSSVSGYNLDAFLEEVVFFLPEGPAWFPKDMDTDQPIEVIIAEFIREKILLHFEDEIPHAIGVQVEEMEYDEAKDIEHIYANVYVERESQKGIIIGKKGAAIKKIGTQAREDLEQLLGCKVYLD